MSEEAKNIELRSEEVQEILGKVPNWLTRWGISVVFIGIAGLLVIAGLVRYPELVESEVTLTSNQPPVTVVAKTAGNLEELFVEEGDSVRSGQLLAVIQNTMNEEQLEEVNALLDSFLRNPTSQLKIDFPESLDLGSLQDSYANFLTNFKDYKLYAKQNVNAASIGYIKQQIFQIEQMNYGLTTQAQDCNNELAVLLQNYQADQNLLYKGIISQRELQETETAYYQKKSACESITMQVSNNDIRVQELKMQIFGLSSGNRESDMQKFTELRESANKLRSDILLWKEQFLIMAPTSGIASLNEVWSNNQYVNREEEILSIIREDGAIKTRALISNKDIGKVLEGQEVNIKFQSYSYMQFGLVKGKVANVSAVPRDNFYQVDIVLDNELKTTYDKTIRFQQGMVGSAQIVTEKRTVLERIFDQFKFIFSKKYSF